jgi:hypothetical protein
LRNDTAAVNCGERENQEAGVVLQDTAGICGQSVATAIQSGGLQREIHSSAYCRASGKYVSSPEAVKVCEEAILEETGAGDQRVANGSDVRS